MLSSRLFVCLTLAITVSTVFGQNLHELIEEVKDDIERHLSKEQLEVFYERYYDSYDILDGFDVSKLFDLLTHGKATNKTCHTCNKFLGLAQLLNKELLDSIVRPACDKSNSVTSRVCYGLLDRLGDPLLFILHNTTLTVPEACSVLFGHGCTTFLDIGKSPKIYWELKLPEKIEFKPKVKPSEARKKVLHLTDIHLDLWYEPGSVSNCNEPLCCRPTSLPKDNTSIHDAGKYGDLHGDCDIPLNFARDSIKQIAERHPDIDYVFWTGDNVPHDVWNTTQEINLRHNHNTAGLMMDVAFNNKVVIPVLGNHEAHPINMYVPHPVSLKTNQSMHWLYDTLANDYWAKAIDTAEAKRTFLIGGYYSKNLTSNWKVIVLNTNAGYKSNFWCAYDPVDSDGQLAWLIEELYDAEKNGVYVTILAHIPPMSEMYDAWKHNYMRIYERFAHLINAAYMGHTHNDELIVLYNEHNKPFGVNYISGSLTTYSYLNPNYRIFEVDENGVPQDYSTYFTDLTQDNDKYDKDHSAVPQWELEYEAKKSYRLEDLSPKSWNHFINETTTDTDLAFLYYDHFSRFSSVFERRNISQVRQMVQNAKTHSPFNEK